MKGKWVSVITTLSILIGVIFAFPSVASAQAAFPGGTYSQNFDTLANTGTSSTVPTGWAFAEVGGDTNYTANAGGGTTGDTYSYGSTSSSERAFGALDTNATQSRLGVQFQNTTGKTIGILTVSYICEQWRKGGSGSADRMDFQYSTNATSLTTGTWIDVNALDCISTVTTTGGTALDGNNAANRTALGPIDIGSIGTPLNIASGATVWFRWNFVNISGSDDGLTIDDFSMAGQTPNAVTLRTLTAAAPINPLAAVPAIGLVLAGGLAAWRRRKA